jgi:hypothetical protein
VIEPTSNLQTPAARNQNMLMLQATPNTMKVPVKRRCFNYGEKDHYAHVCPKLELGFDLNLIEFHLGTSNFL